MRAVDATLAALKRAGVTAIFGLPGGPVIATSGTESM